MVTDPGDYLARHYAHDLAVHEVNCVCGMTIDTYATDGRGRAMHDWQAFALVQYEMNLLQQACHAYDLSVRIGTASPGWPAFRSIRCMSQSRLGHPVRVLERYAQVMRKFPFPRGRRFERAEILQYDCWFFDLARARLGTRDFDRLIVGLRTDPDCREFPGLRFLQSRGIDRVWETVVPEPR